MLRYTIERILLIVVTIFLVITINYFLLRLDGSTPFENPKITPAQKQLMLNKYGLNDPIMTQYVRYLKNLAKGDFGESFKFHNQPVLGLITSKLPHTIRVGLPALIFGLLLGGIMGAIAAIYRGGFIDHIMTIFAIIFVSVPSFILAAFLQYYLAGQLGWFPYLYDVNQVDFWTSAHSIILPAISIALGIIAYVMRLMRSELVEVLNSDYILLARAKGLSKPKVITRHAVRNALIPVMTIVGPMALNVIYGSIIVEQFFGVPGLSSLMINALNGHDYFLTLGINTIYTAMYVVIVLLTDLLYGVVDPRIRIKGGE